MRRREFITPLDGAAAAWPVAARVQQTKRVGVLMNGATSEPTGQSHLTTFVQGLRKLGWIDRQNLRIEVRWSAGDTNRMQAYATDLVGLLRPDVVLVASTLGEDQATHLHDHPEERPHAQHGNLARRQSGPLKRSSQRGS